MPRLERGLRRLAVVEPLDRNLAARAAHNYRTLRERGITIGEIADLIIGTFCIEYGHAVLHDDHDFAPFEKHLGLNAA
jgi:predicted nucleic acid-binding protein